jgi:hypothetical protein
MRGKGCAACRRQCDHDRLFPAGGAARDHERSPGGPYQSSSFDEPLNLMVGETDSTGLVERDNTVL